jgi:hypothetical protein
MLRYDAYVEVRFLDSAMVIIVIFSKTIGEENIWAWLRERKRMGHEIL